MDIKEKTVVVGCSIRSKTGYGEYSRLICNILYQHMDGKLFIVDIEQGNTNNSLLENKQYGHLIDCIKPMSEILNVMFIDVWFQICGAQSFRRFGVLNVGITAGAQAVPCHPSIIQGCNQMDVIYTMSQFGIQVLKRSQFNIDNNLIKLQKPLFKLIHGLDPNKQHIYSKNSQIEKSLDKIKQNFCFYFFGDWLPGSVGNDRKDIGRLIQVFTKTFQGNKDVALVLKITLGNDSNISNFEIMNRINDLQRMMVQDPDKIPSIYLLHGTLTSDELYTINKHQKIKCFVTFTHGETYGIPIAEFSGYSGKPVLAPYFSAMTQYLNSKYNMFFNGSLTNYPEEVLQQVPMFANYFVRQSRWFTVNYDNASNLLMDVYSRYQHYCNLSKHQQEFILQNYSIDNMKQQLLEPINNLQINE